MKTKNKNLVIVQGIVKQAFTLDGITSFLLLLDDAENGVVTINGKTSKEVKAGEHVLIFGSLGNICYYDGSKKPILITEKIERI